MSVGLLQLIFTSFRRCQKYYMGYLDSMSVNCELLLVWRGETSQSVTDNGLKTVSRSPARGNDFLWVNPCVQIGSWTHRNSSQWAWGSFPPGQSVAGSETTLPYPLPDSIRGRSNIFWIHPSVFTVCVRSSCTFSWIWKEDVVVYLKMYWSTSKGTGETEHS
jgi:hypothetical protein